MDEFKPAQQPIQSPAQQPMQTPAQQPANDHSAAISYAEVAKTLSKTEQKSQYFNNSIFWIELEKIVPNPYQPRREFDPHALRDLAESIRMYGILQPLVVTRREIIKEDGGLATQYELISGERRLRASKLAGLSQAPVIIRAGEDDARVKLELAIIENLQREDLNAVDRARSFQRLSDEFGLKHVQIAEKMGKSREYVTNTIRLLALPEHMLLALSEKKISEGHTRPLLMLVDRPEEQETLFKEIVFRKITVREAEQLARRIAVDRARKKDPELHDPEIRELENKLNIALGTRVLIETRDKGGRVVIDFLNNDDLRHILDLIEKQQGSPFVGVGLGGAGSASVGASSGAGVFAMDNSASVGTISQSEAQKIFGNMPASENENSADEADATNADFGDNVTAENFTPIDDSTPSDSKEDEGLYSIKNFSI